jgi:hypothetical protein
VSEREGNLLATVTGFMVSAEATESRGFRSLKKNLKIRNPLIPASGRAGPQQSFVALGIDFDHAKSFQEAGHLLGGAVCPSLKSRGG